ncbi:MAG TPA: VOC family protein [Candidatus Binataceae bacterium]|nr:VOC family protein [Candidatus Binataceae bacterium]
MIDHIGLKVTNFERSRQFYAKALEPLGYRAEYDDPKNKAAGFGSKGALDLWIGEAVPAARVHIALRGPNRAAVRQFHEAAIAAGGKDNGAPGLRTEYTPTYYAAFVLDPDGNNLEVVCHEPA